MIHADHVRLLREGVIPPHIGDSGSASPVWADLGSGSGAFTLALADLLGPSGRIYSVDKDPEALREQQQAMRAAYPGMNIYYVTADFTHALSLPMLDGLVMANSLHFVRPNDRDDLLHRLQSHLKPDGCFILVEYDVDRGNIWVPYPISYSSWEQIALRIGFTGTKLLATRPSRFLGRIYSALSQMS
jgi:ubiquinone/menaquinone biosynthesis C-methylase UbiE